jgi:FKBP-type peptidyl-prolyl cis-trans isomerase (trigger factor)
VSHSTAPEIEELERAPARRVYRARFPEARVARDVSSRVNALARTVRLPGFRPGKIPAAVLIERYGAKSRTEVLQHLAAEAANWLLAQGGLASSIELTGGGESGDAEFRVSATYLPELDSIDFESIHVERLTGEAWEAEALENHVRQQVLDHLDALYQFPIAPALIAAEHARVRELAALEFEATSREERAEIDAELKRIAERRVRLGAVVAEMARRNQLVPTAEEGDTQMRDRLMEERLIRFILSKARVTERPATQDELAGLG